MSRTPVQWVGLVLGLLAFLLLAFVDSPLHHIGNYGARPAYAAAVSALMAIWWLTEAVPIYHTACVPLLLFPIFDIFGAGYLKSLWKTLVPYLDPYIFLFAGGMCIAAAMQQWDLHRRIALKVMKLLGTHPPKLLLGFLCSTAFVSLWISNTATAAMMLPIGIAIIRQMELQLKRERLPWYGMAVMLAIAYGANIGGMGTKIGTAPNAQFSGFMHQNGYEISFLQFLVVGLPFVIMLLPFAWYLLWRIGRKDDLAAGSAPHIVEDELRKLGPIKPEEQIVLAVFTITALAWMFGQQLSDTLKPYISGLGTSHVEGGTSVMAALVLIALRFRGRQILEFRTMRSIPWATLLLLGGGFAMAAAIQQSGLSEVLARKLIVIQQVSAYQQVLLASLATVALSAVASNVATTAIMLVVLKDAVVPSLVPTILFAATFAASCDFALPAGTPPNAIVFGSGYVRIPQMARAGVVLDILAAVIVSLWAYLIVPLVLGSG